MEDLVRKSKENGYLSSEEIPVIATTVIPLLKSSSEESVSGIKRVLEESIERTEATILISEDNKDVYEEARKANLSVNYYKEYTSLKEKGIINEQSDIKGKSIAELRRLQNEIKQQEKQEERQEKIEHQNKRDSEEPKGNVISNPRETVPGQGRNNDKINGNKQRNSNEGAKENNKGQSNTNIPAHVHENRGNDKEKHNNVNMGNNNGNNSNNSNHNKNNGNNSNNSNNNKNNGNNNNSNNNKNNGNNSNNSNNNSNNSSSSGNHPRDRN